MRLSAIAEHRTLVLHTALPVLDSSRPVPLPRLWTPKQVFVTKSAQAYPIASDIAARAATRGSTVTCLKSDRLPRLTADSDGKRYAEAKSTLAIVVAPPGSRKLRPIPPSADWQFHLAQGCPAHCQYCYLAGSLTGPPITRVYANLDEILTNLRSYAGRGSITSNSPARQAEGTTFEASCYTDPLAIENLTGSLAQSIRFFGSWEAAVQLRWTTKFDNVDPLLDLPHNGRTRVRFSVNADEVTRRFEGGTPAVASRLQAMRRMAEAGYPIGLTVAPIVAVPGWQDGYSALFRSVAQVLAGFPMLDLTVELITHRFTPGSKQVLLNWYPVTPLEMDESKRKEKRTKFGSLKYVYPADQMRILRHGIEAALAEHLPMARILYWT